MVLSLQPCRRSLSCRPFGTTSPRTRGFRTLFINDVAEHRAEPYCLLVTLHSYSQPLGNKHVSILTEASGDATAIANGLKGMDQIESNTAFCSDRRRPCRLRRFAGVALDYTLDSNRSEGLVVVSLTLDGKPLDKISDFEYPIREVPPTGEAYALISHRYASARQAARSVQDDSMNRALAYPVIVKRMNSREALDILDTGQAARRLAVLRLPPGNYGFHTWRVREPDPYGENEYTPAHEFSYRFRVQAGEAMYFGRLNLHLSNSTTQRVAIEDRRADDLSLLGRKYPALRDARVVASIVTLHPRPRAVDSLCLMLEMPKTITKRSI